MHRFLMLFCPYGESECGPCGVAEFPLKLNWMALGKQSKDWSIEEEREGWRKRKKTHISIWRFLTNIPNVCYRHWKNEDTHCCWFCMRMLATFRSQMLPLISFVNLFLLCAWYCLLFVEENYDLIVEQMHHALLLTSPLNIDVCWQSLQISCCD